MVKTYRPRYWRTSQNCSAKARLPALLRDCSSGRELIERGLPQDVEIAGEVNVSSCVPVLREGAFRRRM